MAIRSTRPVVMTVAFLFVVLTAAPAMAQRGESDAAVEGERATYEGRTLNLAEDWEGAKACMVWPDATEEIECFSSEAQLDARVAELEQSLGVPSVNLTADKGGELDTTLASSNCSSYLKMYDGTSYTGAILYLRGRYMWTNLVNVGFNQRTSSFKVGACSAYFADLNYGGGGWYPTWATQKWDKSTSMMSGWNNDVSSVYIT